jgi:hypothetical protein
MNDSDLSASELRRRYQKDGALSDDQLSAAQLRARHAVKHNARDFSTRDSDADRQASSASALQGMILVGTSLAVIAFVWFYLYSAKA